MLALKILVEKVKKCNVSVQIVRDRGGGGGCTPIPLECGLRRRYVYMDPKCKVGLITGGTSGIGLAAARELLCNDFYRVVVTDMDTCKGKAAVDSLNSQFGKHRACFMILDTYKEKHYYDCLLAVIKTFGNLDVMVNTPGIPRTKSWEEEINANILSTIRGTMIGTELMSRQKLRPGGVIINVASAFAYDNFPPAPVFVTGNNGIVGFSKSWGATPNYKATKVRVVAICPSATDGVNIENTLGVGTDQQGMTQELQKFKNQGSSSVGRGIVFCVQHASSGTVWFVDNGALYKAHIPDRLEYSEKIRYV